MDMGRPREYATQAERQRAYRERQRQAGGSQASPPDQASQEALPQEDSPSPERSSSPPDIEGYVADALLGAEIAFAQINPNANMSTKTLAETLERAESY